MMFYPLVCAAECFAEVRGLLSQCAYDHQGPSSINVLALELEWPAI